MSTGKNEDTMRALKMTKPMLRDPAELDLAPLAADPRYCEAAAELAALEKRFAEAERRLAVAKARARGQQPSRPILDRARDLVAGGAVISSSPEAEASAAHEELEILNRALYAQREKLTEIAGEISFETCKRLAPLNAECLRAALDAVTALHAALEAARVLRARLIAGGYQISEPAMPVHLFPAAAALGDPDRRSLTPAGQFRDWLIAKGII